jgi:hypothetical protein
MLILKEFGGKLSLLDATFTRKRGRGVVHG